MGKIMYMYIPLHSEAEVSKCKSQDQTKSMTSGWTGGGRVQSIPEDRCTC